MIRVSIRCHLMFCLKSKRYIQQQCENQIKDSSSLLRTDSFHSHCEKILLNIRDAQCGYV